MMKEDHSLRSHNHRTFFLLLKHAKSTFLFIIILAMNLKNKQICLLFIPFALLGKKPPRRLPPIKSFHNRNADIHKRTHLLFHKNIYKKD